ncbi:MAG: 30S ribosomal protein S17 [Candidatus Kerfeldbacteria bacterium]
MTSHNRSTKRKFIGTVVSDKMDKTVVVRIDRVKTHRRYRKQYRVSLRLKAHDEKNAFHVGDRVIVVESRPLSRDKMWRVVAKAAGSVEEKPS